MPFQADAEGARHAAQFRHDQDVARADVLHELIPAWPIHAGAGHLVGEDLLAPCRFQGVDLGIKILTEAADAGISDSMQLVYVHSAGGIRTLFFAKVYALDTGLPLP